MHRDKDAPVPMNEEPAPGRDLRVVFPVTRTGDAIFIDTGEALYLIDCGLGPNYAAVVAELGHRSIAGLVLTHCHPHHWLGLPSVLPLLAPDAWLARPGTTLPEQTLRSQSILGFYRGPTEQEAAVNAWISISPAGIPPNPGVPLWDANVELSSASILLSENDRTRIHAACIVPVLQWGRRVAVFGADFPGSEWDRLAAKIPQGIDLLQAPNHGCPPGRMVRSILESHLRPRVVVLTDGQPLPNDHVDWYSDGERVVHTLRKRRPILVKLENTLEAGPMA